MTIPLILGIIMGIVGAIGCLAIIVAAVIQGNDE